MSKKNKSVIIGFLIVTNLICLFIIARETILPRSTDSFLTREELINHYKASPKNCGATISLSKRPKASGTEQFDMACLLQGSRKLAWTTLNSIKTMLDLEYRSWIKALREDNIQEMEGISYRPEGRHTALLFIKQQLVNEKSGLDRNDYLTGYLLGYDLNDIQFFYQRWAFYRHLKQRKKVQESLQVPSSYADFSSDLKNQFQLYLEKEWLMSKGHERYERDKKNAMEWLSQNEKFSDEQLEQQIKMLKRHLSV